MSKERVVLDANVLYGAFLRDVLLSLFAVGLYEAKWTDQINEEWGRNLLANRPHINPDTIVRTVATMNQINPSPLVEEYQHIVDQLNLPDPDDRHVLAAAIAAKAKNIVTWNLEDFPPRVVEGFGIAVQSPDQFLSGLIQDDPDAVVSALRDMRERMRRPKIDVAMLLDRLSANRLVYSRTLLERFAAQL
jgi:predicted nucleic acid-binding protein